MSNRNRAKAASAEDVKAFIAETEGLRIVQFTAEWCARCHSIVAEIEAAFEGETFEWMQAPTEVEGVMESYDAVSLPRIDVYGRNGQRSLVGFECSVKSLRDAFKEVQPPLLVLDADF